MGLKWCSLSSQPALSPKLCCSPRPKLTWHCQTPIREIIGSCDFNLWNANKQLGLWANVYWRKQMMLKKKKIVLFCFFCRWMLDRNICQVCNSPTHNTWADWKFANREVLYWDKFPCCLPPLDVLGYSTDVSHLWDTLLTEKLLHFLPLPIQKKMVCKGRQHKRKIAFS